MDNRHKALIRGLYGAGLFQLGTFTHDGGKHVQLRLEMLPSYPVLLGEIANLIQEQFITGINRIVCTAEAVALGTAISLASGIPLIWHTGMTGAPSRNFVGAYDIHHPAVLVMLNSGRYSTDTLTNIYREADSVGLQITQMIGLIDDVPNSVQQNSIGLVRLADAVRVLIEDGSIPSALGQKALEDL